MNGPTNGNRPGSAGEGREEAANPLEASYKVQWHLEQAFEWFIAVDELVAARNVQSLLDQLTDSRMTLVDSMIEEAERASAAAMIGGE